MSQVPLNAHPVIGGGFGVLLEMEPEFFKSDFVPRKCLVYGTTESVNFYRVKLRVDRNSFWHSLELPFSESGWEYWQVQHRVSNGPFFFVLWVLGVIILAVWSYSMAQNAGPELPPVCVPLTVVFLLVPLGVYIWSKWPTPKDWSKQPAAWPDIEVFLKSLPRTFNGVLVCIRFPAEAKSIGEEFESAYRDWQNSRREVSTADSELLEQIDPGWDQAKPKE